MFLSRSVYISGASQPSTSSFQASQLNLSETLPPCRGPDCLRPCLVAGSSPLKVAFSIAKICLNSYFLLEKLLHRMLKLDDLIMMIQLSTILTRMVGQTNKRKLCYCSAPMVWKMSAKQLQSTKFEHKAMVFHPSNMLSKDNIVNNNHNNNNNNKKKKMMMMMMMMMMMKYKNKLRCQKDSKSSSCKAHVFWPHFVSSMPSSVIKAHLQCQVKNALNHDRKRGVDFLVSMFVRESMATKGGISQNMPIKSMFDLVFTCEMIASWKTRKPCVFAHVWPSSCWTMLFGKKCALKAIFKQMLEQSQ